MRASRRLDGNGIRHALMVSLRYDEDAGVRMKALEGLQRYVGQDQHVRDAVLEAVAHDPDAAGTAGGDRVARAGAVGFERAAGAADGRDAGCESLYPDGVVQRAAEFC